jgi:hypothetical protein
MQLWDDLMTLLIAGLDMNFLSFSSGLLHKLQILYHFSWFLFGYACILMGPQLFTRTLAHEFCEFFYIDS